MTEHEIPNCNMTEPPLPPEGMRPKSRAQLRSWIVKTVLMLALIAFSIVLMFSIGNYVTGGEHERVGFIQFLKLLDYRYFALLLAVLLLYLAVESAKYAYLLKVSTGKFRWRVSIKTMFLGKYYDGITPLSMGGQAFQIVYLHKKDVPGGVASAIPLIRYIVSSLVVTAISIVLLILTPQHVPGSIASKTMLVLAAVSLALNGSIPLIILLFTIFPKKMMRLVVGAVGLLAKMHIVKRKYHATKKCVNGLLEYSGAMKLFAKKFLQCLPLVLLCVIETLLNYAIPFFVVLAVGHDVKPTFELLMQILCLSTLTRYTALLIPTPGNTGAMEATGSLIFSTVTSIQPMLGWVVLVWRFFTYYLYILSGIGISIFEVIRDAVRQKRRVREENTPSQTCAEASDTQPPEEVQSSADAQPPAEPPETES